MFGLNFPWTLRIAAVNDEVAAPQRIQSSPICDNSVRATCQNLSDSSPNHFSTLPQSGTSDYDRWVGVVADMDGAVVCVGASWGLWGTSNAGGGDIAAFKLDENRTEVWRWQVSIGCPFSMHRLRQCTRVAILTYHERYSNVSKGSVL